MLLIYSRSYESCIKFEDVVSVHGFDYTIAGGNAKAVVQLSSVKDRGMCQSFIKCLHILVYESKPQSSSSLSLRFRVEIKPP
jgi:hypothetical protein